MGNNQSIHNNISFEDVQQLLTSSTKFLLINTLSTMEQNCLIQGTLHASQEEDTINNFLQNRQTNVGIVVYGKNANDTSAYIKHQELRKMGFSRSFLYPGGLFEWLLLQDIYGFEEFPTTTKELDILKFKPSRGINQQVNLLEYI